MEIKIIISDSAPGASPDGGALQVSRGTAGSSGAGEAGTTGQQGTAGAAGGSAVASQATAPPDLLQAAAALGAINAGPAPAMTSRSPLDGPMPYMGSGGTQPAGSLAATQVNTESAGPAPGSSSSDSIEITSAPEGTGH